MIIKNLSPGGFASNSYLVIKGGSAVLIDATAMPREVARELAEHSAVLEAILLTHTHFDHILSADALRRDLGAPLLCHADEADFLTDGIKNASSLFLQNAVTAHPADRHFEDGATLCFGELTLRVLHTPGHTAGSVCLLCDNAAFTGDTLFADCHGRTDLYSGSSVMLKRSLEGLFTLPEQLRIYPGHGDSALLSDALSTLGI